MTFPKNMGELCEIIMNKFGIKKDEFVNYNLTYCDESDDNIIITSDEDLLNAKDSCEMIQGMMEFSLNLNDTKSSCSLAESFIESSINKPENLSIFMDSCSKQKNEDHFIDKKNPEKDQNFDNLKVFEKENEFIENKSKEDDLKKQLEDHLRKLKEEEDKRNEEERLKKEEDERKKK